MTESTNEAILEDLVECLRDQIAELTLRLEQSERLCGAYRSTLLRQPTADEVCSVMGDLKVSGCVMTKDGWENLDSHTKELFLDDLVAIATI